MKGIFLGLALVTSGFTTAISLQAQPDFWARPEWVDLWWFLTQSVEKGHCSSGAANAIWDHVSAHGLPTCSEEAFRIEGLSKLESQWLVSQPNWQGLVNLWMTDHRGATLRNGWAWTTVHGKSTRHWVRRELRGQWGGFRGVASWEDSLRVSGSLAGRTSGWSWVLGSYDLGWGHGLTIPRSDPFGLSLFLGGSEIHLPRSPSPRFHSQDPSTFTGVSIERQGPQFSGGVAFGQGLFGGMLRRSFMGHELCGTAYLTPEAQRIGLDWSSDGARHFSQIAVAGGNDGLYVRASTRWARTREWAVQARFDVALVDGSLNSDVDAYVTWLSQATGAQVQFRIRGERDQGWHARATGRTSEQSPLSWSFRGAPEGWDLSLRWSRDHWQVQWWAGKQWTGPELWGERRSIQSKWKTSGGLEWGVFAMDGTGTLQTAYVSTPMLDTQRWQQVPAEGSRMGAWMRARPKEWHGRWQLRSSWHLQWSPSQQDTFRCAWRMRFDA